MSPFHAGADARLLREGETCADGADVALYLRRLFLPLSRVDGVWDIALADNSAENVEWLRAAYGAVRFHAVAKPQLIKEIEERFRDPLSDAAIFSLARARPALSAQRVVTKSQACALTTTITAMGLAAWQAPYAFLVVLITAMSLLFIIGIGFRALLVWFGSLPPKDGFLQSSAHDDLPLYTILAPLYREAAVLPGLVSALSALDYPKDRLQIILIVEDDDLETAGVAETLSGGCVEVVRVPVSLPRTKPKATNYALHYARGDYVVIYDAEDRPEPDQLCKAVESFRRLPRTTACLQARLAIHNADSWTAQSFALDYGLWFESLLPGLNRLGAPTPLGGTSNHFRTAVLRAIHAWDPFNVTEDADIGIRLAALGYRVAMLDSATLEEAPIHVSAWIKQRSRWLKGYMQTWLVHSRGAGSLIGQVGLGGFLTFQLFIGGAILSALINPILWAVFALSCFVPLPALGNLPGYALGDISAVGAISSNVLLTYLAMLHGRRDQRRFTPYALTVTLYWLLISVAAYRGLWHLVTKPFHWEKTEHGLGNSADA
jgi:cellulose synthase/poly-beta-1,6-N-acetylglucosamine synthase-like glycosyltransferase